VQPCTPIANSQLTWSISQSTFAHCLFRKCCNIWRFISRLRRNFNAGRGFLWGRRHFNMGREKLILWFFLLAVDFSQWRHIYVTPAHVVVRPSVCLSGVTLMYWCIWQRCISTSVLRLVPIWTSTSVLCQFGPFYRSYSWKTKMQPAGRCSSDVTSNLTLGGLKLNPTNSLIAIPSPPSHSLPVPLSFRLPSFSSPSLKVDWAAFPGGFLWG